MHSKIFFGISLRKYTFELIENHTLGAGIWKKQQGIPFTLLAWITASCCNSNGKSLYRNMNKTPEEQKPNRF